MTDCNDLYCARIKACLEGDYTTWTEMNYSPISGASIEGVDETYEIKIAEKSGCLFIFSEQADGYVYKIDLEAGTVTTLPNGGISFASSRLRDITSLLGTYFIIRDEVTGSPKYTLNIYKNGSLQLGILDLYQNSSDCLSCISISSSGLYIAVITLNGSGDTCIRVFKGS
jgi:hypothetical protein